MNAKMRRFCEEYSRRPNATKAAAAAGYSKKTAYAQGSRLLKNVEVIEYLQQLDAERRAEGIATADEIRMYLSSTMRNQSAKDADRLRAAELLAKTKGMFLAEGRDPGEEGTGNVIIYIPDNGRDKIDTVTPDEDKL
jgi:phage terminase small subunit